MPVLPKRKLGRTNLDVTVLAYGALELAGPTAYGGRSVTPDQAQKVLNAVLDSGINLIDTSIDYGDAEELMGQYIAGRRKEYFLATKCGCPVDPAAGRKHSFDRKTMMDGVNQSLRRLRTDYLDLVQLHNAPARDVLEREGTVQTLLDLKREGKVRFIGTSSVLPNIVDHIKLGVFDAFQIPYSALQREHEKVISDAAKAGAGTIIRGGVARGEPGDGQGQSTTWNTWEEAKLDELLDGMTRMEFILRFTISHPQATTTIVGTQNQAHLQSNVAAAAKGPLPAKTYGEAKRRLAAAAA